MTVWSRAYPDPVDRRATFALITDAGRSALRGAAPAYLRGIREHFSSHHMTDEELHMVQRSLSACNRTVTPGKPWRNATGAS